MDGVKIPNEWTFFLRVQRTSKIRITKGQKSRNSWERESMSYLVSPFCATTSCDLSVCPHSTYFLWAVFLDWFEKGIEMLYYQWPLEVAGFRLALHSFIFQENCSSAFRRGRDTALKRGLVVCSLEVSLFSSF